MTSINKLPYETIRNPKKMGCTFIAICAESQIYIDYNIQSFSKKDLDKNEWVPLVLMMNRWDGKIGFVGGKIDPGENPAEAVVREIKEEVNLTIWPEELEKICVFETEEQQIYYHRFNLGRVDKEFLRDMMVTMQKASCFLSEGNPFFAQLTDYYLENFLKNNFPLTVKEQLELITPGI